MNLFRFMQGCLVSALVFFWGPYIYHLYVLGKFGVSFAFTSTYWTFAVIAGFVTIVVIRFIRHPFGLVGACILEFMYGWLSVTLWAPPIVWWKNSTMAVGALIWGFSCLWGLVLGLYLIKMRKKYVLDWAFSWKRLEALVIALSILIAFFWWSYGGFSSTVQMNDLGAQGPSYFKVSFWGFPSPGGNNASAYDTTAAEAELDAYRLLNSTFYIGVTATMLDTPDIKANLTSILRKWSEWDLHAVINIQPLTLNGETDTVGYYNIDQADNLTMKVLEWRNESALWNIEGICFEAVTPQYGPGTPDYSAYYQGVTKMGVLLYKIQSNNASLKTTVFAPASRIWDLVVDNDADLDFLDMTITNPPTNWNRYGFMTFRSGPKFMSPYWTYMHQNIVVSNYSAANSVPMIGHAGEKNFALDDGSTGFDEMMKDLLICKYLGVYETVVHTAESMTKVYSPGQNGSERLIRIYNVITAKPPLEFKITNDWEFYQNFTNMVLMGNFDSIYVDVNVYLDLAVTIGDIFTFLFVPVFCYFLFLGIKERRTPRKPRPTFMERVRERITTRSASSGDKESRPENEKAS